MADPDRRARFAREAQVLASLNHPHVAGIFGFEDSSDTQILAFWHTSRGSLPPI